VVVFVSYGGNLANSKKAYLLDSFGIAFLTGAQKEKTAFPLFAHCNFCFDRLEPVSDELTPALSKNQTSKLNQSTRVVKIFLLHEPSF